MLGKAKLGLARVDGTSRLVWEGKARSPVAAHRPGSGPQLAVWGYQVLDRDAAPAAPARGAPPRARQGWWKPVDPPAIRHI